MTADNCRIYFNPLDSKSVEHFTIPVGTEIIAFLQEEFPMGFDGMLQVIVGIDPIEIEDLDYKVQEADRITMLVMPGEAITIGTIVSTLINAAIATAIGFVINLIFKPSTPGLSNTGSESPVYSLSPTRNQARLSEPIPVDYGRVSRPPDFGAAPYQFFFEGSNDQYVDELLCIGQGDYLIEDVLIGDTPVLSMKPGTVRYWLFGPGEHDTFGVIQNQVFSDIQNTDTPWPFRENVYTSPEVEGWKFSGDRSESVDVPAPFAGSVFAGSFDAGTGVYTAGKITNVDSSLVIRSGDTLELQNTVNNNTSFVVDSISVDPLNPLIMSVFEGLGVFTLVDEDPLPGGATYTLNTQPPDLIAGPFRAQKLGQTVDSIDCDIIFPGGLYRVDGNDGTIKTNTAELTFTYQQVDPVTGVPIGGPSQVVKSWTSKERVDLRSTIASGPLVTGAYEVTVELTSPVDDDSRKNGIATWVGLKGNVTLDTAAPAYAVDTTMMAIRMKATNGLGSAATARIRVIGTRQLASGNSDNPVTIIKDIWTQTQYGMRRNINELDLATLDPLEAQWDGEAGPKFNGGFDQRATGFEALQGVAGMTGGKIVQDGALTTIVFDAITQVRSALFTSANMLRDTLQIIYTFDSDGDFDGIQVEYRDPDNFDARYTTYPTTATNPENFLLFGVTDATYAGQFAQYLWNVKSNRRKLCKFTTELEGLLPRFRDRIGVAHPMPRWAQSGVVIEVIDATTVRVDQALDWTVNNIIILRDETGTPTDPLRVQAGADPDIVVFIDIPTITVSGPDGIEPTSYAFGTENDEVRDFILTKITPKSDLLVEIEAQTYTPTVYEGAPPHMGVSCWDVSFTEADFTEIWVGDREYTQFYFIQNIRYEGIIAVFGDEIYQMRTNSNTSYALSDLVYSDDFGQTWVDCVKPFDTLWDAQEDINPIWPGQFGFISFKFLGSTLYANFFYDAGRKGTIFSTLDGGQNWNIAHSMDGNTQYEPNRNNVNFGVNAYCYHIGHASGSLLLGGRWDNSDRRGFMLGLGHYGGETIGNGAFPNAWYFAEPTDSGANEGSNRQIARIGSAVYMTTGANGNVWYSDPTDPVTGDRKGSTVSWDAFDMRWNQFTEGTWRTSTSNQDLNGFLLKADNHSGGTNYFQGPWAVNSEYIFIPLAGWDNQASGNYGRLAWITQGTGDGPPNVIDFSDSSPGGLDLIKPSADEDELYCMGIMYLNELRGFIFWYGFRKIADNFCRSVHIRVAPDAFSPWSEEVIISLPDEFIFSTGSQQRGSMQWQYSASQKSFVMSTLSTDPTDDNVSRQHTYTVPSPFLCTVFG